MKSGVLLFLGILTLFHPAVGVLQEYLTGNRGLSHEASICTCAALTYELSHDDFLDLALSRLSVPTVPRLVIGHRPIVPGITRTVTNGLKMLIAGRSSKARP
jgi:hypothetical protein